MLSDININNIIVYMTPPYVHMNYNIHDLLKKNICKHPYADKRIRFQKALYA